MGSAGRQYRTRLEVLREILGVGGREGNKTRIIRLANLNPNSFDRYIRFCTDAGLVDAQSGRYRTTPAGESMAAAIDRVLSKAEELDTAVHQLRSAAGRDVESASNDGVALRLASAVAWAELTMMEPPSGSLRAEARGRS